MQFVPGSRICCVITGASRGFGRSIAVALARQFSDSGIEGDFLLVSRSEEGLRETRNRIVEACSTAEGQPISLKLNYVFANIAIGSIFQLLG